MIEDTLKERGTTYGEFIDNATIAQELKDIVRDGKAWFEMPPDMREAVHMIFSKISRMVSGDPFHIDSWTDIQGFAKLVEDRLKNETQPEPNEDSVFNEPMSLKDFATLKGFYKDGEWWSQAYGGPMPDHTMQVMYKEYLETHANDHGGACALD